MIEILTGDCRQTLKTLEPQSVQCCITSPPYFGLRDYGHAGQIGLEASPSEFVAELVAVFREVHRVLKDDGTLWLNLGDSYMRNPAKGGSGPGKNKDYGDSYGKSKSINALMLRASKSIQKKLKDGPKLKEKDLIGIPWRVAFALQDAGWYLRSEIIWAKPNPMPESVTDRPTKSHETIFLLTKNERYFYDYEAIKEPFMTDPKENYLSRAKVTGRGQNGATAARGMDRDTSGGFPPKGETRNKRSVWTVPTRPYAEAHFATFPPDLIKPCVLAGTKPGDTILDPFGGSGTTGAVAVEFGRRAILCELNPAYVDLIHQRTNITAGLGF